MVTRRRLLTGALAATGAVGVGGAAPPQLELIGAALTG
jgi:hypothetical protein